MREQNDDDEICCALGLRSLEKAGELARVRRKLRVVVGRWIRCLVLLPH